MDGQDIPSAQVDFWDRWNAEFREQALDRPSTDQRDVVLRWLDRLDRNDLNIIEVGCGAGWLCRSLTRFGDVVATDLAEGAVSRAAARSPEVDFVAGDFMELDFGAQSFDVVIALEVLSHVPDQAAFVAKLATLLRPGGALMLATQNRPVLKRHNTVDPAQPGQLRRWVDSRELRSLLDPHFEVRELFSITPRSNKGWMRAICSIKVNTFMERALGKWTTRLKERLGLGWTLMVLAERRN
ncbi:MAG: methyltransferase domain-containing protein [Maricaulaceae bacterium]